MKKSLQHLLFGSLFAAILVAANVASAQPTTNAVVKPKREAYPFHGIVAAVSSSAKTVSLARKEGGDRVLNTDSQSTFMMDGKPVTLSSIKVGYYLSGTAHKEAAKEEFILKAKVALEAPAKKGTNTVTKAVAPVMAPVVAAAAEETATNAVVKAKKKKKKAALVETNAPAANQ